MRRHLLGAPRDTPNRISKRGWLLRTLLHPKDRPYKRFVARFWRHIIGHHRQACHATDSLSYQALMIGYEWEVGPRGVAVSAKLAAEKASWKETLAVIAAMAGRDGLMIFTRINQGDIASLSGPRSSSLYLGRNPIIATGIPNTDICGGMLVAFRIELDDDRDDGVLSYDLPSSLLASFRESELSDISLSLDKKIGERGARVVKKP